MRHWHLRKNRDFCPTVNLDQLWSLVPEQDRVAVAKKKDTAPIINCLDKGFFKVLGKGRLPTQPMVVKAKFFTKRAEEKIKAVGGTCVLVA